MDNNYSDAGGQCFCEQHPGQFSCAYVPSFGGGSDFGGVDFVPNGGSGGDPLADRLAGFGKNGNAALGIGYAPIGSKGGAQV